jgi:hypothetical protein
MWQTRFVRIGRRLHEAAANAAWIQWQALGAQTAARAPTATVDPEALVLFSLWLGDDERRVRDFLYGFAQQSSRLMSVQRLKRAMRLFPADAAERVGTFAATVANVGRDPRWHKLAGESAAILGRPGKVTAASINLGQPASLMLRLRTAFGVDVRTDTLAYLIGLNGVWADVKRISDALLYAKFSVRGACEALADARLIQYRSGRPATYYADRKRWGALLAHRNPAAWHPWMKLYPLVLRLLQWLRGDGAAAESDSLSASLAREFMLEHGDILQELELTVPDGRDHRGEAYLPVFERSVSGLTEWLDGNA